ncbi:orotate phosphoribosyltransferase [Candidatus Lokiarchaeum ossiferum]|uniref:orotate phosphoribosyltransferase n=1 Tax=Candidatus Lokiarchaeum ossiferum TaxID=2951803 RepID=UPI00352CF02E
MEDYKKEFIEFMVQSKVLIFGDFMTKSGRKTPYFVNTGKYRTGSQMKKLGKFYAEAIRNNFEENVDVLFGPAYKGIPLVVTTSIALSEHFNQDVSICFNRKEAKDHGEGGNFIGKKLEDGDKVIIVEDVTTAGTSIRQSVPMLNKAAFVQLKGLVVSVDRMEKGKTEKGALVELADQFNMKTCAIVTLDEIIEHLHNNPIEGKVIIDDNMKQRIDEYRAIYGCQNY